MKNATLVFLVFVFFGVACTDRDKKGQPIDTPTTGFIKIAVDESLRPLVDTEVEVFEALYKRADIEAYYFPESDAVDALMKDSVRLAVVTRSFTQEEKNYFKEIKITPTELKVATSAIALIVNPSNPDSTISVKQLKAILNGEISRWNQLGEKRSLNTGMEIVFDNPNSGLIRQLKDSVARVGKLPEYCFALENNEAVIDFVAKNESAMGLIGLEWISDRDDSTSNAFLDRVRVVAVAGDSTHFQPYQAYIALKHYPLTRKITILSREARNGLGTGFMAFFASERGQRIVLKSGLVPETMPLRIVNINRDSFEIEK